MDALRDIVGMLIVLALPVLGLLVWYIIPPSKRGAKRDKIRQILQD